MKSKLTAAVIALCILCAAQASAQMLAVLDGAGEPTTPSISLLNGHDLGGWAFYLEDASMNPADIWKWDAGQGLMHCTGAGKGYVRTDREFSNYEITMQWRWPEKAGNSGLMLHTQGPDQLWPKGYHGQMKSGHAGDFNFFDDAMADQKIVRDPPNGHDTGSFPRPGESAENPVGEWNTYKAVCTQDSITLYVNGKFVNKVTGVNLHSGRIGMQNEGVAVDFRNIIVTPLGE